MSKAELIEQAKTLGIKVTSKMKVAEIEEAIHDARFPAVLNLEEAASYIGMTADELMLSFHRGLPPGRLGFKDNGVLVWKREDLLPSP